MNYQMTLLHNAATTTNSGFTTVSCYLTLLDDYGTIAFLLRSIRSGDGDYKHEPSVDKNL
jgi:hypothetical protein